MGDLIVHLVRHGQSFNTHRPAGEPYPANPPLTPTGVEEARRLARRLGALPVVRLISSPMRRAVETAVVVGEGLGRPVEVWTGCYEFREEPGYRSWGKRELGSYFPSVLLPEDLDADGWYYGEERLEQAISRADDFLAWLRDQSRCPTSSQMVVVTHGAFTRVVLARALSLDSNAADGAFIFHHTGVTTLRLMPDSITVLTINDTSHLAGEPDLDPLRGVSR